MIFSSTSDVIRMINARRMRWPGRAARVGEDRSACLVPKSQAKLARGRPRVNWRVMYLKKNRIRGCGLDSAGCV
jgi:hypothetical protein